MKMGEPSAPKDFSFRADSSHMRAGLVVSAFVLIGGLTVPLAPTSAASNCSVSVTIGVAQCAFTCEAGAIVFVQATSTAPGSVGTIRAVCGDGTIDGPACAVQFGSSCSTNSGGPARLTLLGRCVLVGDDVAGSCSTGVALPSQCSMAISSIADVKTCQFTCQAGQLLFASATAGTGGFGTVRGACADGTVEGPACVALSGGSCGTNSGIAVKKTSLGTCVVTGNDITLATCRTG